MVSLSCEKKDSLQYLNHSFKEGLLRRKDGSLMNLQQVMEYLNKEDKTVEVGGKACFVCFEFTYFFPVSGVCFYGHSYRHVIERSC